MIRIVFSMMWTQVVDWKWQSQKVKSLFCGFLEKRSGSWSSFYTCISEKIGSWSMIILPKNSNDSISPSPLPSPQSSTQFTRFSSIHIETFKLFSLPNFDWQMDKHGWMDTDYSCFCDSMFASEWSLAQYIFKDATQPTHYS